MKHLVLLSLLGLGLLSFVPQALANPSIDLRVIVIDPVVGEFDGAITFATSPVGGNVFAINQAGDLPSAGDNIVAFGGDVYVDEVTRIVRINLLPSGGPDGGLGNNVEDITGDVFSDIVSITVNSGGILYVADSDDQIYSVNPSGAPSAGKSLVSIAQTFDDIRDIAINGGFLYILDVGAESGFGAVYKVNLSDSTVELAYSGSEGDESLTDATAIAVDGSGIFVSGSSFSFGAGILKITSGGVVEFSDNSPTVLSFPLDIAIDEDGNDLYVTEGSSIYRFSLASTPSQPILTIQGDGSFSDPVGITTLLITGSVADLQLNLEKTVNATSASPGDGLLYTITATNEGPDDATSVIITDTFPNLGVESVLVGGQLSFTSEVHYTNGTIIQAGSCERIGESAFLVGCTGFGTLAAGDFVVVTLEGSVIEGAVSPLVNVATVQNVEETAEASAVTTLSTQLSLSKTASPGSVIAGDGFIDYTVRVENHNTVDALGVTITDTLPNGVSGLIVNSEPLPESCLITTVDETTTLQCGPYNIVNTVGVVEIKYRVNVDADAAIGSIVNSVELTCSNCASLQTSVPTTITRQSDLSIEKMSNTDPVIAGQDSISYTVTVTNDGPSDADDVVITDNLPDGVAFVDADSTECAYDSLNHDVICTLTAPLSVGEQRTFTIDVSVNADASGDLVNTASITSSSTDDDVTNNQFEAEPVPVEADTDVLVVKTGPPKAFAGGIITYDLSVTNSGPSAALDVEVQDVLPTALTFIAHTEPGSLTDPDCSDNVGTIVCEFGNVGPGITQTKSIQAKIALDFTGTIINEAEVFSDTDSNPDNNISSSTTTIEPPFCGRPESDFDNVITGTSGNDNIQGTNDDDLILGLGGNDKIHGKNGNDCIIGGDGNDKIWGGKGDDGIEGNAGNDYLHGQQGNDTIIGGDGNDKIWGGKDNDIIDGGDGNDYLHGQQGNDHIVAGDGDNKIWGGQGTDTITAGDGNNQIHGNQANDHITSGSGNDRIWGGQGDDNIDAGSGNNQIHGNQGNDNIVSESGNDWIHAGAGVDIVNAGDGNDKIYGAQGHDQLSGEDGDDIIHGGQGDDFIDGGDGYDKCNGAQGDNTIDNCEAEDKKMKEDKEDKEEDEENEDDDEDDDEDDHHGDDKDKKEKKDKDD
jgi:uncharacterized repeat protein (TIGR01451 family)